MRYKIFLSDFDGTLVRADGTISEKNRTAIARYRERGGIFAVVTGRMLPAILPRLKELGIHEGLAVACQGATVMDLATGRLLKDDGFSYEDGLKALRAMEGVAGHVHCYTVDCVYSNVRDDALEIYEKLTGVSATVHESEPLSLLAEKEKFRLTKILCIVEEERCDAVCEELRRILGDGFYITRSGEYLAEILPAGVSKAGAVEFLSEYYGVPCNRIAAIGDQLNDLPMIGRAGGKFAVGNADSRLKERASVVASCEEDGVAEALNYAMGESEK